MGRNNNPTMWYAAAVKIDGEPMVYAFPRKRYRDRFVEQWPGILRAITSYEARKLVPKLGYMPAAQVVGVKILGGYHARLED